MTELHKACTTDRGAQATGATRCAPPDRGVLATGTSAEVGSSTRDKGLYKYGTGTVTKIFFICVDVDVWLLVLPSFFLLPFSLFRDA